MYKYGQKVKVTSGFYEGMEGTVHLINGKMIWIEHNIPLFKGITGGYLLFPESSLELIK